MEQISFAGGSAGRTSILLDVLKDSLDKIDVSKILEYGCPVGMEELRDEIACLHKGVTKDNVLITSSSQQALNIALNYVTYGGRKVLLQQPAFFGVVRILKKLGVSIETFDNFENLEEIIEKTDASVVYLSSNFQNPTGECMPERLKERAGRITKEKGIKIIEDNPYDLLYYDGNERKRIFEENLENTIYLSSFSKILAPGVRVGYIVADEEIVKELKHLKINEDLFTSTLCQQVCLHSLQEKNYLEGLRKCYKERRQTTLGNLEEHFKNEDVVWSKPRGGIFIQLRFQDNINTEKLIDIASKKYSLILESDKYAYYDGKSRNSIRINFVKNDLPEIREGIRRLYCCIEELKNGV